MVAAGSKCRTCRGPAIIDLPRHNANFCAEHFMGSAAARWPRRSTISR